MFTDFVSQLNKSTLEFLVVFIVSMDYYMYTCMCIQFTATVTCHS